MPDRGSGASSPENTSPLWKRFWSSPKKNDVVFYLEIKPGGSWGGEHALVGALRESGEIPRTVVISFDPAIVLSVRKIEPTLMTGLLYDGQLENPLEKAVAIGARQLVVRGDLVTPALIAEVRRKDLQVVCWTVNHPAHMRMLAAAGVDGIMSDYPDRLVAAVKKEAESISYSKSEKPR